MTRREQQITGRLVTPDPGQEGPLGPLTELSERLRFSLRHGQIWLDTQRVALIHLATLASLRRDLIEALGLERARGFLTRMGYASGVRDAAMARKLQPTGDVLDRFAVGPRLRALQGIVLMELVRVDVDLVAKRFYAELVWHHSFEVESQIADGGVDAGPVCWMEVGYASGYASAFTGRTILFKEVECRGMGATRCRAVGKPIEAWGDEIHRERLAVAPLLQGGAAPLQETAPGPDDPSPSDEPIGASIGFRAAFNLVRKVAPTSATVLLLGETGVGKERFARAVHDLSPRARGPFIAVNCAAIPESLIEAELFGVVKGAYTGATESRPGKFERAEGGTLFLDEIGTLSETVQAKLLRAIQHRTFERVGDTTERTADVRIVTATNVDLRKAVEKGRFREDLFFRLNVFPIHIPPLRERREDIPLLSEHFLQRYARIHGKTIAGFTQPALDALYQYEFPGNIRELENLIERAVILTDDGEPIDVNHLFAADDLTALAMHKIDDEGRLQQRPVAQEHSIQQLLEQILDRGTAIGELELRLMEAAVARAGGNLAKAARLLGMTRPQLAYRLRNRGHATRSRSPAGNRTPTVRSPR